MRPKEINLVDLLVNVLLHWRMFFVWMLTGAILFFGGSYLYFCDMYQSQQVMMENMQSNPNNFFSEEEIQNVNYVISYEAMYRAKEMYLEKAPLMKIDPNYVSKAEATILIVAESDQKSYDIKKIYEDIIQGSEFVEKMVEGIETEVIGVEEMILLENEYIMPQTNNMYNITHNAIENTDSFRIAVIHRNESQCRDMLENVIKFLEEKRLDIENVVGSHEIVVIDQTFGIVSDTRIADKQKNALTDISVMEKAVKDLKDELTDRELQYYSLLTNPEGVNNALASPKTYSLRDSVRYIIMGIITAVFLYTFVLVFIYISNNKVRVTDDLQKLYNIPQLGVIPGAEKKQKMFGFVDKWILSLYAYNKQQLAREEAMEYTSVFIKTFAGKEMLKEIYFVGCRLDESAFSICEEIGQRLGKENIQTIILNNILYDARVLNKLGKIENVILAIYAGSTRYNEVAEELELIRKHGVKILGAFVFA